MQRHADIDEPEEVNEMCTQLEEELLRRYEAQRRAEAAQPEDLPMAQEDDIRR